MNDIVGYCTIKKNATTGVGLNLESFMGKDCRVLEFAQDGGVLCVNNEATSIAMFDKDDVIRKFECGMLGEVLIPPNLDMVGQMFYASRMMNRKGGYNYIVMNMVIEVSLMKGKLTDDFLFQKEREENEII